MHKILIFILLLFSQITITKAQIYLDGFFNDWKNVTDTFIDSGNDGTPHDFKVLEITNDSDFLYLKLSLAQEINLQDFNEITIYFDTDNNATTGFAIHNIGADFTYSFGKRRGTFSGNSVNQNAVGLITLPTITSKVFEIAFNRNAMPNGAQKLFPSDQIKLVIKDETAGGDVFPNNGFIQYQIVRRQVAKYQPIKLEKEDTSLLRIMTYNILNNGPMNTFKATYFSLIFKAVKPDIFAFQEFFATSAEEVKTLMDNTLPLGTKEGWYALRADAGNITLSKYPIKQHWEVYAGSRITAVLIDLPEHYIKDILVINSHFRCCTANDIRQREADAVSAFFKDIRTKGGVIDLPDSTPVIIAGDLNLVGYAQQLSTLQTGDIVNTSIFGDGILPDWDNSTLENLLAYQTDAPLAITWQDQYSDFAPGWLDYMIFTNSSMQAEKAYVLETSRMDYSRINYYKLDKEATKIASDHLPKVADFRLAMKKDSADTSTSIKENNYIGKAPKFWPNPANSVLNIDLQQENNLTYLVEITDLYGRTVIYKTYTKSGSYTGYNSNFQLDIENLQAGFYLLNISNQNKSYTYKLLKNQP